MEKDLSFQPNASAKRLPRVLLHSYRNQQWTVLSLNISVCHRAIKDRQAIMAIFHVFLSLLSVKALKLPLP